MLSQSCAIASQWSEKNKFCLEGTQGLTKAVNNQMLNQKFQLNDQSKIEGCIFVNPVFSQQSWGDFFHAKVFGTSTGPDFLNWYHFRNDLISDMLKDCKEAHQQAFQKLNQNNLKEFVEAVNKVSNSAIFTRL